MRRFLAAIRFLTILPVPDTLGTAEEELASSVPFFPLVGLLLGAVGGAVAWALAATVPPILAAAGVVVVLLVFSGALHMDGLSDTADGMLSSRPRERVLEIMRDSHIGAMGVVAIVCVLLVKFASLASATPENLWATVVLMPVAGRSAIVVNMALLPYVRQEGLGKVFCRRRAILPAIWAVALLGAVSGALFAWQGLAVAGLCTVVAAAMAGYFHRKIGGSTGDTFGAVCELAELVPAIVLAVCPLRLARWIP
ncbi:MAG TPA: adenosylcobinamide-GDP ribazoletransferase [Phycisphaerales bacterium]|nr:adenosylcobinamide-GDP ribazoletransferase [Phycisphaerales bacterium]